MNRISIEYRLQARYIFAAAMIMFYFFSKMAIDELINPETTVKFRGVILSKAAGEAFLYGCSIFSITMLLVVVVAFILTFIKREAVLDEEKISVPKGPFRRMVSTIMYSDILSHKIERAGRVRVLVIYHKLGILKIPSSAFSSEEDFGLICLSMANKKLMADV